jgi:hypothetical protein
MRQALGNRDSTFGLPINRSGDNGAVSPADRHRNPVRDRPNNVDLIGAGQILWRIGPIIKTF